MFIKSSAPRRLSVLAAACLLSVALPALPTVAKEKPKTNPAAATEQSHVDFSVSIPTIEAVDSNMDEDTLREVLSGDIVDNAEALAGLTAASITVPQIEVTITAQENGDEDADTATVTFTDLVLSDVVDGVAGSMSLAGTDMNTVDANVNFGTLSANAVDIGGVLGFYGLVDTSDQTELKTVYTDFTAEGGSFSFDDMTCTIGAASGAEFKARPLQTSFVEMIQIVENLEDEGDEMSPAAMAQFMRMYADMITAFETSEVTFEGMDCQGTDDGKRTTFSLAGMTMGAMSPGVYPAISMDGFDMSVKGEGSFSVDNITVKPMDLSKLIETLQSVPDSVDEVWLEANVRKLFPEMEGLAFNGMSLDIVDPELEGGRIKVDIGAFDLTLGNYLDGIPTVSDISASSIQTELPADSGDETIDQLRALGLTSIDMGFRMAAAWDEASSTIDIEEMSVNGTDLGSMTLTGTIANATAGLFNSNPDIALANAMGIAVKSLDLDIVDDGASDIGFGALAEEQGSDAVTLRPIYADLAKGTIISALIGMADAAAVGNAVGDFVSGEAKTLQISVEAKDGRGVGVVDFMKAETDPASLVDKVNVTAQAE